LREEDEWRIRCKKVAFPFLIIPPLSSHYLSEREGGEEEESGRVR